MVLERLSWRVTRPNHASFRLLFNSVQEVTTGSKLILKSLKDLSLHAALAKLVVKCQENLVVRMRKHPRNTRNSKT